MQPLAVCSAPPVNMADLHGQTKKMVLDRVAPPPTLPSSSMYTLALDIPYFFYALGPLIGKWHGAYSKIYIKHLTYWHS